METQTLRFEKFDPEKIEDGEECLIVFNDFCGAELMICTYSEESNTFYSSGHAGESVSGDDVGGVIKLSNLKVAVPVGYMGDAIYRIEGVD